MYTRMNSDVSFELSVVGEGDPTVRALESFGPLFLLVLYLSPVFRYIRCIRHTLVGKWCATHEWLVVIHMLCKRQSGVRMT